MSACSQPLVVGVNTVISEAENIKLPVTIIRDRIASKRLYEAHFLFRQLSDELSQANREQLGQQLEDTIHGLEQKHRDAVYFAGQGNYEKAAGLLEEIEQATVDFPDLDREKERLSPVDPILDKLNRGKAGYQPPGGAVNRANSIPGQPHQAFSSSRPAKSSLKPPKVITALILALPAVLAIIVLTLLMGR